MEVLARYGTLEQQNFGSQLCWREIVLFCDDRPAVASYDATIERVSFGTA